MYTLKAEKLSKSYKRRKVVDNVSISVAEGEVVGLLGPNGAGKTTTFYIIVGFVKPERGKVFLNNEEITHMPMYLRARKGIGYLPQEASVFRKLTVEENIMAVLETRLRTKEEQVQRLDELLSLFHLEELRNKKAFTLSGGERRRVEVARALASDPSFLLLDEPFTGIDPIVKEDIQSIVVRLKEKGIGILVTDHNVRETLEITDRAYIMYEGKILVSGTRDELVNSEEARRIYLGKKFKM
ncbi:MAG TPA: LPS export ABC transporter ATP-binding protein [bacterium (Candidatus Stahlbacteria)]|nr:LPS export ABC transporter ATP-binding protein [Candidatus Stahlbacteria bacterium]